MSTTEDPTAEHLSIANELINARTALGFTQVQLAEVSGVSRSAIKGYESGRNMPGSRELRALCVALAVTPNQLLFGVEEVTFDDAPNDGEMPKGAPTTANEQTSVAHSLAGLLPMLTKAEGEAFWCWLGLWLLQDTAPTRCAR